MTKKHRKVTKRVTKSNTKKKTTSQVHLFRYIAIFSVLVLLAVVGRLVIAGNTSPVLGTSTFLAERGPGEGGNQTAGSNDSLQAPQPPQDDNQTANQPSEIFMPGGQQRPSGSPQQSQGDHHGAMIMPIRISSSSGENNGLHDRGRGQGGPGEQREDNDDVEIASTSANGFMFRSHDFEVHSHFPISIDPTTHILTVTTPSGTKQVTILPNQAIQNLLEHNIISSVSSSSATASDSGIQLTSFNNEPAFEIEGVQNRHFLGFIPVSLDKTVTVSAQSGDVISTQESFSNKFLEFFSF